MRSSQPLEVKQSGRNIPTAEKSFLLLRLARSEVGACSHFVRVTQKASPGLVPKRLGAVNVAPTTPALAFMTRESLYRSNARSPVVDIYQYLICCLLLCRAEAAPSSRMRARLEARGAEGPCRRYP